jgi:hypothetical protein
MQPAGVVEMGAPDKKMKQEPELMGSRGAERPPGGRRARSRWWSGSGTTGLSGHIFPGAPAGAGTTGRPPPRGGEAHRQPARLGEALTARAPAGAPVLSGFWHSRGCAAALPLAIRSRASGSLGVAPCGRHGPLRRPFETSHHWEWRPAGAMARQEGPSKQATTGSGALRAPWPFKKAIQNDHPRSAAPTHPSGNSPVPR